MNVDTTRLRFADIIAGVSGLVLLVSLFLPWYSRDIGFDSASWSLWDHSGFIAFLIFLAAAAGIALAVLRALGVLGRRRLPVSPGLVVLVLGGLAVLLALLRLLDVPSVIDYYETGRSFGGFLALLAAIALTLAGWLAWNEEGRPKPDTAAFQQGVQGFGQSPSGGPGAGSGAASPPPPPPPPPPPAQSEQASYPPPPGGAPNWYDDPAGEKRLRYWDGSQWTHHVAD
jgi:hypothetical protein